MKKHSSCKTDANNTVQVGNVKFSENYPMQFLQGTAATPAVPEFHFFCLKKKVFENHMSNICIAGK